MSKSGLLLVTFVVMFSMTFTAAAQPFADDSAFTVSEGATHSGQVTASGGVGSLTFSVVSGPSRGTLVFNADGTFTFQAHRQPTVGFVGSDSFSFQASDGSDTSNEATVTVTITPVNDPPVAQDSAFTVAEGGSHSGVASATDVDGDALTFSLASGPSRGSLVFNADGSFTFLPFRQPTVGFVDTDSFRFVANDGLATSNEATITATIIPVNDPPVAHDSAFTVAEGGSYSGAVNATDVDGDELTFSIVSGPGLGTLVFNPDGNFSYQAHLGSGGPDGFSFLANDGLADSSVANVSITILPDQIFADRFEE